MIAKEGVAPNTTSNQESAPQQKVDNNIAQDKYPTKRGFTGYFFFVLASIASKIFLNFHARGKENIPQNVPYVIAANHQTYVDGLWIAYFLPWRHFKVFCCLAASDLETSHGPLGRLIMRVGRGIAVDRYGSAVRGLIKAKKEIENGHIMLVHPEGTRSPDGNLGEFKDGAAYMAVKANVPLLPVYVEGGYNVYSRHMKWPKTWDHVNHRRKKVTIYYGKPFLPSDYDKNAHKLTDALTQWMKNMEKTTRNKQIESLEAPL